MAALFTLLEPGDHLVSSSALYGGTVNQLKHVLRKMSVELSWVDPDDLDAWRTAVRPNTKAFFAETIGNPGGNVLDIEAVAAIAHEHELPLIVDNTFATPYLCRPIEWGADIVVHSATKFLGGHGTSIGGVVVESGAVQLVQRALPGHRRAVAGVPRAAVPRDLRHLRLPDEAARRDAARPRWRHVAVQRVPVPSGARDAVAADGAPRRQRAARSPPGSTAHELVSKVTYAGLPGSRYAPLVEKYLPLGAGRGLLRRPAPGVAPVGWR